MMAIALNDRTYYFKAGEFFADGEWIHKKMYHENDFEIIFCLENSFSLLINEQFVQLKANDCLILPPETTIKGAYKTKQSVRFYWLHFYADWKEVSEEEDCFQKLLHTIKQQKTSSPVDHCFLPPLFNIKEPNFFIILMNQLLNVSNTYYYTTKMADYLTQAILIELGNQYLLDHSKKAEDHFSRVHQISDWIRANMSTELTIQVIADHFEISQDYLSRLFKKEFGQNLRDYLIHLKISVAKVLLVQTTLPIKVISELSYYSDEKYFIRMFKKKTGLTPNKYRNAYEGTHQNNPYIDPKLPIPQAVEKLLKAND